MRKEDRIGLALAIISFLLVGLSILYWNPAGVLLGSVGLHVAGVYFGTR